MIETERLVLRLPQPAEAAALVRYHLENQHHLAPWSPRWPPGFFTEDHWRARAADSLREAAEGISYRFFMFEREAPAVVVGNIALTQIQRGVLQACNLGYGLAASAQGRGLMTEAVRAAVRFAFQDLHLHRVEAGHMPRNLASSAVLRRAGFEVEGHSREYLYLAGRWEDHTRTAIINPDWTPDSQS